MKERYKIIISSRIIYKEIELPVNTHSVSVGTSLECDIRLHKDLFFEDIGLLFTSGENWTVTCSDNLYINLGDTRKLITKELSHGDNLSVIYQDSNNEIFTVEYVIDFEYEEKNYDRAIDISNLPKVIIGGNRNSHIYFEDKYVKKDYIQLKKENSGWVLTESKTLYGVYVNGIKQTRKTELKENDFISLAGFSFCIRADSLYTDSKRKIIVNRLIDSGTTEIKNAFKYPEFNRSTRIKNLIPSDEIDILDPPAPPQKPSGNIIMQLLPAIIMLAVTIVLRGLMSTSTGAYIWISIISMGIGIITSVVSVITERKKYKKESQNRIEKYNSYIDNKKKYILDCRNQERIILNEIYYPIGQVKTFVEDFSVNLFDRSVNDEDYLSVRIGTGSIEAIKKINYKQQEQFEHNDELLVLPEQLSKEHEKIYEAPIIIDLKKHHSIGVIGTRKELYEMLKIITIDLVVRHYYTDLKIFLIVNEENTSLFNWIRMLPHIQNEHLGTRNIVCDSYSKNIIFEFLYKELSQREAEKITFPNIVVLIYNDMGIKSHPISKYIEMGDQVGVSFMFFDEHQELLPNGCGEIVKLYDQKCGEIIASINKNLIQKFDYCSVTDKEAIEVATKLAPIYCEEVSLEATLTKNITLFEMLNIMSVEDIDLEKRWNESQIFKSMAAPLGVKTKNQMVYLDLHEKEHGPHGLVAGTTGSGKSEILQTYILAMATLFHPYEVGFVIIDFKGGGMVNQFKELPHLIGGITNIDGREINRSLLSIKAELRKRQELFAKYDVNHVDDYIKLYKKGETNVPLPHLILVVDEFAELKMDQPDFMKELISAARIGRSLGVHLILSTQKPSGVVDAQIWSNSKFKLCLKVQNKEDSNEVLKSPVAAEIKEPGRAYLQVGNNEIFELFQSAYSGAPASYDDTSQRKSFVINSVDFSGKRTPIFIRKKDNEGEEKETQLVAVTNYIEKHCSKNGIEKLPGICLPPLDDYIELEDKSKLYDSIHTLVLLGIYDDPDNQYQGEAVLNLLSGNTVIIGSSQYGKTNLLQLIIRNIAVNYTPKEVQIYVLDFASMALKVLDGLNHIGGVVTAADDEKLKNLIRMTRSEIKSRKETFSKLGITSFVSYKEAGNTDIPHIVIMIDNFIALKELYSEYEDEILNICREGVAVGINIIITSPQTNGIGYKYLSNFSNRICFYCNQSDEYGNVFDRCRMTPKNVPGRALYEMDKVIYEVQTYISFDGIKEIDRVEKIKEFVEEIKRQYKNVRARQIPEVPQVLDNKYVLEHDIKLPNYQVATGIDYESVELVTIDLSKALTIGVTGKKGYGKTNLIKLLVNYLQRNVFEFESKIYVVDDYEKQLEFTSQYGVVDKYTIDIADIESLFVSIEGELESRLDKVKGDGIQAIEEDPLIMVIIQNKDVFAQDGISKVAVESYKRILKIYKDLKILFVFSEIENIPISYGATEMMKLVKDIRYLYVMEDLQHLKLIDINAVTLRQYKKEIELGDAYLITETSVSKQKIIKEGGIMHV